MRIIEIWRDYLLTSELIDGRMRCSTLGWKDRFWENIEVIGPDLVQRKVVSAEDPQKERSDFMQWILFNRMMSVRLVLDSGKALSLEELKKRVVSDMHDESLWSASGDPAIYREHAAKAQSFDDLWEIMNGEYWEKIRYDPSGFAMDG